MRACHSGREFHMASFNLTQQAFLECHVKAFNYFGGIFKKIRYDNLTSAVKKVLRGRKRIETERFIAMRSHYLFESVFCLPGKEGAHEKGGVEGGVGRFRRNHLVPVPHMRSLESLNQYLINCCKKDDQRVIQGKSHKIIEDWVKDAALLQSLPQEPFPTEEIFLAKVSKKSLVRVKSNDYSAPVQLVGLQVEVRCGISKIAIMHSGNEVANHIPVIGKGKVSAKLEHYYPLLRQKPRALAGSVALSQARSSGQWPAIFDSYWQALQERYGESKGTQILIEILWWIKPNSIEKIQTAMEQALKSGSLSIESLQMLVRYYGQNIEEKTKPLQDIGRLISYDRPMSEVKHYDLLLLSGRIN
jgi:hypothetical protein